MAEQMEEVGMGFLDMEGKEEPPVMPEEDPIKTLGIKQFQGILSRVVSRFSGGKEEIERLIENDTRKIIEIKEDSGEYDNIEDIFDFDEDSLQDPTNMIPASIPGASLTGNLQDLDKGQLGAYPWETPPELNSITEAFNFIYEKKEEGSNKENILKLLYAGVPAEAIARTISFEGFLTGKWTPDIAELLIIPVLLDFVADAQEEDFEARIFNDFDDDSIDEESVLEIMEGLNPEKYNEIKYQNSIEDRRLSMEPMGMDMEEEPVVGSFLDMEEDL